MIRRGYLSGQTDNKTANEESGKGERNDFTSGKANRHGGGDGRPEGRLSVIVSILLAQDRVCTNSQHIGNPVGRESPGSPYSPLHWNGIDILVLYNPRQIFQLK